jgi:hypothetical protein
MSQLEKTIPDEQKERFAMAAADNLISMYETEAKDLETNISKVDEFEVEIVVSKALGGTERLEAKAKVPFQHAKTATLALYDQVFNPRVLGYAKEVVDYQLEADRMSREVQKRDLEEQKAALESEKKNLKNNRRKK